MKKLHWSVLKRLYRLRSRFGVYRRMHRNWLLDNRNWIDQQLIIRRPYEVRQLARCRQLIRGQGLEYFFDIGANFGLYSVLLSDEPNLSEIHAFEPLPRNVHQFAANLYLNSLDSRVSLHNHALGDRSGQIELFVDPNSTGVSTLLPPASRNRQAAYKAAVQIEVQTFDEVVAFDGIRALVKIDVEGAELMVLSGMSQFLSKNVVMLQVETTAKTVDLVNTFMRQIGYQSLGCLGADCYYGNVSVP